MERNDGNSVPLGRRGEKLMVKWKTCGKTKHRDPTGGVYRGAGKDSRDPMDRIKDFIACTRDEKSAQAQTRAETEKEQEREFCEIFVFEFDKKGRIVKHVMEHTEEGGGWDHMTRVVSVADSLLGLIDGGRIHFA
ncbi:Uu.00g048040.m01.CDS01 [Anthostomella pinea]|uniref:Uu.00g048040.m01.CDS01 n=1 Tax=Anthostomella pinea TaxID=933095 RepID=A0AAI8VBP0_9PEZI|nr:Uu.00g048040.m01.CDS01 [Anthostomella pinea]